MCASVLQEAGYRTGMFVSPYVLTFRERIQVDGQMIPEIEMAALCEKIQTAVDQMAEEGLLRQSSRSLQHWECFGLQNKNAMWSVWRWDWAAGWMRPLSIIAWCQ